tara:strand:+ start:354 stop:692 length:339 start_codon:yes stop_codon:yes gene_type:complete
VNVNIKKQYKLKKMPGTPAPIDMGKFAAQYGRFPTAEEMKAASMQGGGFDNSALMQDPKYKQMDTMNQGMEVSMPYLEANKQAFSKNNPMNAISQETPVGDKVDEFLRKMGK